MKAKRFLAAIASLGMAVSLMAAMPLSAYADTVYTTIEGAKVTSFDKYLVMESDAVVPSAGFSFTISSGEAVAAAAEGTSLPVFAGVGTPKFVLKDADGAANDNDGTASSAVVNFSAEDTDKPTVTIAEKDKGTIKTVRFNTPSNTTDEKYAQKRSRSIFQTLSSPSRVFTDTLSPSRMKAQIRLRAFQTIPITQEFLMLLLPTHPQAVRTSWR